MNSIPHLILLLLLSAYSLFDTAQKAPTRVAPGVISKGREYCTTLTPNGKTMYFVRQLEKGDAIMRSTFHDGNWSPPTAVEFTGTFSDTDPLLFKN